MIGQSDSVKVTADAFADPAFCFEMENMSVTVANVKGLWYKKVLVKDRVLV